jgi:hypothetical protein
LPLSATNILPLLSIATSPGPKNPVNTIIGCIGVGVDVHVWVMVHVAVGVNDNAITVCVAFGVGVATGCVGFCFTHEYNTAMINTDKMAIITFFII